MADSARRRINNIASHFNNASAPLVRFARCRTCEAAWDDGRSLLPSIPVQRFYMGHKNSNIVIQSCGTTRNIHQGFGGWETGLREILFLASVGECMDCLMD
jgi:hypothetical protein